VPESTVEVWDLFISHASEDKEAFVRPLALALERFGVRVWYDEYTLALGDSLSRSIDKGLANSDYGLVVLSPAFIAKKWPEYELRGLTARELAGAKVILPVWHNITHEQLLRFSPPLADKLAVRSDQSTPLQVAIKIIEAVRPDLFTRILRRVAHYQWMATAPVKEMRASDIKVGPIQHETLSPDLISRIRLIRASLLDVYPHSMAFWMDGFKRDSHPSSEIAHWEHVASVYLEYLEMAKPISDEQRQKSFNFISNLWIGPDALEKDNLPEGAGTIIDLYKHAEPPYDFEEGDLPSVFGSDPTGVVERRADLYDKEHFPKDLPEDLVRELMESVRIARSP
jgi:TIR domain-containing protein